MNDNWQPIETAPKNGEIVLLYRPTAERTWGKVTLGMWESDSYSKNPRPYWQIWLKIGCVSESRAWEPTHWMPLPEPPIAQV